MTGSTIGCICANHAFEIFFQRAVIYPKLQQCSHWFTQHHTIIETQQNFPYLFGSRTDGTQITLISPDPSEAASCKSLPGSYYLALPFCVVTVKCMNLRGSVCPARYTQKHGDASRALAVPRAVRSPTSFASEFSDIATPVIMTTPLDSDVL